MFLSEELFPKFNQLGSKETDKPLEKERELSLMTEDIVGGSDLLVGVCEEEAHHAEEDHGGGVHLQRGHLTD